MAVDVLRVREVNQIRRRPGNQINAPGDNGGTTPMRKIRAPPNPLTDRQHIATAIRALICVTYLCRSHELIETADRTDDEFITQSATGEIRKSAAVAASKYIVKRGKEKLRIGEEYIVIGLTTQSDMRGMKQVIGNINLSIV